MPSITRFNPIISKPVREVVVSIANGNSSYEMIVTDTKKDRSTTLVLLSALADNKLIISGKSKNDGRKKVYTINQEKFQKVIFEYLKDSLPNMQNQINELERSKEFIAIFPVYFTQILPIKKLETLEATFKEFFSILDTISEKIVDNFPRARRVAEICKKISFELNGPSRNDKEKKVYSAITDSLQPAQSHQH